NMVAGMQLDKAIKLHGESGTTATVVLFKKNQMGDALAKVAWVGDSRAVLFTDCEVHDLTSDHRLTNDVELSRIGIHYEMHKTKKETPSSDSLVRVSNKLYAKPQPINIRVEDTSTLLLANKTTLSLLLCWGPWGLLCSGDREYGPGGANMVLQEAANCSGGREYGTQEAEGITPGGHEDITPGGRAWGTPGGHEDITPGGLECGTPGGREYGTPGGCEYGTPGGREDRTRRISHSFVGIFTDEKGHHLSSKPRVFNGKTHTSVQNTRSLGDNGSASAIISCPDITDVLLPPAARIVIASDGVWDVMTTNHCWSILKCTPLAAEATPLLLKKTLGVYTYNRECADDVTIIVIDRGFEEAARTNKSSGCGGMISSSCSVA
ncbi:hypothetical protein CYMTET_33187, partial [Cymbomonas tetramitiformis]